MRRFIVLLTIALAATAMAVAPAGADPTGAFVDRIDGPFETVVPVSDADNPAGHELMFAECLFTVWRQLPDGSATETHQCELTEPFFEFPGSVPERAYNLLHGSCEAASDYWLLTEDSLVIAETGRFTVTPSGQVHVTLTFPAQPITLEECGLA